MIGSLIFHRLAIPFQRARALGLRLWLALAFTFLLGYFAHDFNIGFFSTHKGADAEETLEHPVPVATDMAQRHTIRNLFSTNGYLQPAREVTLRPNQNVVVRQLRVSVGDSVKVGDVLAYTDSEAQALRADLDRIELQTRNLDYAVTLALAKKSFLSQREFEQKELEHKADKIRKRLAELESTGAITAPISGVVSEINLKVGDFVDNPSQYYIKIADSSSLKIQLFLPQAVTTKIWVGSSARLSRLTSDDQGQEIKSEAIAKVQAIAPVVDPKTGSVYVEIVTEKVPVEWLAGMYVEVELITGQVNNVVAVPSDSIVFEKDQPYVFRVKAPTTPHQDRGLASQGSEPAAVPTAQKVKVKTGLRDSGFTEITEGVNEYDLLVVEGQGTLADGTKVEVVR
jgi:membrane fusion protein (multidrug efflux system)